MKSIAIKLSTAATMAIATPAMAQDNMNGPTGNATGTASHVSTDNVKSEAQGTKFYPALQGPELLHKINIDEARLKLACETSPETRSSAISTPFATATVRVGASCTAYRELKDYRESLSISSSQGSGISNSTKTDDIANNKGHGAGIQSSASSNNVSISTPKLF